MRAWIAVGLLATTVLRPSESKACSCLPQTEQEAIAAATAVFEGDVLAVTTRASDHHWIASVIVRSVTKGTKKDAILTIDAGAAASAMCGFAFTKGKRYVVFAYADEKGALSTSKCTQTREAGQSAPNQPHHF